MSAFTPYILTLLGTLFVWWFSTGVIVYLDGLPKRTYAWSFGGATALMGVSLFGLVWSAGETTPTGAAAAFLCAIAVWGWNEMAFLMGYISGPRAEPCPAGAQGYDRFRFATMAILYHEVALVVSLGIVVLLTSGQPNQFAVYTFALLWLMRLSSKLNLFLGVPNRAEEFLPEGLSYLKSYFRAAPMNALLPVAITAATIACVLLGQRAYWAETGGFEAIGYTLLVALLSLAILEHWLMVLPIPPRLLWGWGLKSHDETARSREMTSARRGAAKTSAAFEEEIKVPAT